MVRCHVCKGEGTIKVGVGTGSGIDSQITSERACHRCYGTGYY